MKNLLTDIADVRVGHADDARLASGVTASLAGQTRWKAEHL
jgi:D-aminopeptidase